MTQIHRRIDAEMRSARRALQSSTALASRFAGQISRLEQRLARELAKRAREEEQFAQSAARNQRQRSELEGELRRQSEFVGEARGRIKQVAITSELLDMFLESLKLQPSPEKASTAKAGSSAETSAGPSAEPSAGSAGLAAASTLADGVDSQRAKDASRISSVERENLLLRQQLEAVEAFFKQQLEEHRKHSDVQASRPVAAPAASKVWASSASWTPVRSARPRPSSLSFAADELASAETGFDSSVVSTMTPQSTPQRSPPSRLSTPGPSKLISLTTMIPSPHPRSFSWQAPPAEFASPSAASAASPEWSRSAVMKRPLLQSQDQHIRTKPAEACPKQSSRPSLRGVDPQAQQQFQQAQPFYAPFQHMQQPLEQRAERHIQPGTRTLQRQHRDHELQMQFGHLLPQHKFSFGDAQLHFQIPRRPFSQPRPLFRPEPLQREPSDAQQARQALQAQDSEKTQRPGKRSEQQQVDRGQTLEEQDIQGLVTSPVAASPAHSEADDAAAACPRLASWMESSCCPVAVRNCRSSSRSSSNSSHNNADYADCGQGSQDPIS